MTSPLNLPQLSGLFFPFTLPFPFHSSLTPTLFYHLSSLFSLLLLLICVVQCILIVHFFLWSKLTLRNKSDYMRQSEWMYVTSRKCEPSSFRYILPSFVVCLLPLLLLLPSRLSPLRHNIWNEIAFSVAFLHVWLFPDFFTSIKPFAQRMQHSTSAASFLNFTLYFLTHSVALCSFLHTFLHSHPLSIVLTTSLTQVTPPSRHSPHPLFLFPFTLYSLSLYL